MLKESKEKKLDKKAIIKKIVPAYVLFFAICFMLLLYEPIMMYATNINDFWFDFNIMIKPVALLFFLAFFACVLGITLFYFVCTNIFKKENLYYYILFISFIVFLITYIQGNFLIGNLPSLDGSVIDWSIYTRENYITLGILLIIVASGVIFLKKFKIVKTIKYSMYLSIAIFLMLSVSLITTLLTKENVFAEKNSPVFTFDGINAASSDKNFFVILLDAVDREIFYNEWQSDDKYSDLFNDFTFYNDALAYYPFTRDSLPVILAGKINHNEKEFSVFSTSAYNNSPLFKTLADEDYEISLYTRDIVWNGKKDFTIKNNPPVETLNMNLISFFKQELKYVLFKYLPYNLKKFSNINSFYFDNCLDNKYSLELSDGNNIIENNPKLEITDKKQFKYIHTEGAHLPFNVNENLEIIEKGTYEQKVHGSLKYVKAFLDRLKDNNVYDNSVIVIMADHGFDETGGDNLFNRMNPLLIVKGINEKHKVNFSDKPVSYEEINNAFVDLANGKQSTELFKDIPDKRTRTMLWHYFTGEDHMVEYETTGKANEIDKFKETGRVFDR